MNEKQYWADAATRNCVWLFQTRQGDVDAKYWWTEKIFLLREECIKEGTSRPYAYGEAGKDWRCYGLPCYGLMAKLLGKHTEEFRDKVHSVLDEWKNSKEKEK